MIAGERRAPKANKATGQNLEKGLELEISRKTSITNSDHNLNETL